MSAVVLTSFTPDTFSGRGLRTVGVIRALARSGEVEVDYVPFGGAGPAAVLTADPAIRLEPIPSSRGPRRLATYLRARAAGVPGGFARAVSAELVGAAARAAGAGVDRVVADGPSAAAAAILLGRGEVVYNAHNLEWTLRAQLDAGGARSDRPRLLARFETRLLARAAETWLPSLRDLEGAAALAPSARLRLVPNVVDVEAIAPVSPPGHGRALFVADFRYEPNRRAAGFLLDEVMPQVWARVPEARVALVGRGLDRPAADPRVELLGFVERLESAYASSDCAVVPLLESGGSSLKLVEAMAYGLPVVATPVAGAGLDKAAAGVHYLEGATAEAFADGVARALAGDARDLATAGRALAEAEYSIAALARAIA